MSTFTMLLSFALPLAQAAEAEAPRGYAWSWAIILLSVIVGLVAALMPAKRDPEVRGAKKKG